MRDTAGQNKKDGSVWADPSSKLPADAQGECGEDQLAGSQSNRRFRRKFPVFPRVLKVTSRFLLTHRETTLVPPPL